jgi:pimeloyl-ACP methyl ester carboxylesterase
MIEFDSRQTLKRVVTAAAAILGVAGFIAAVGEYGHRQITRSLKSDFRDDPARWGLSAAREIDLTARDGMRLHSWLFKSPEAVATVIVLHGHGGNKHTVLPIAQMLYPRYNVMLIDHRGHGESEGARTTIGYEERIDVHAAVDYLLDQGMGPVGIYGMSMGGATAILAAAEDPRIVAIVADSPYGRLRWAVGQVARLRGYPGFLTAPVAYIGCLATALHLRSRMSSFDPVEVVHQLAPRPLLLTHGVEDDIVPVASAHALYEAAGAPKELWLMEGLKHCQALDECYDEFKERIVGFYERWLASADHGTPPSASEIGAPVLS